MVQDQVAPKISFPSHGSSFKPEAVTGLIHFSDDLGDGRDF